MANETNIRLTATDATREAFRSVQDNIGRLQGSIKSIAGPLAAAFSAAAVVSFTKSLVDAANELQDISERTGIAAEKLSALGNAATLNASSQEEMNDAIIKLSKSIAEASRGTGAQADAFAALGISVKDANGNIKDTTDILSEISNAFSRAEDGAVKVKIAQDLLGRSGSNLIPLLNQGANAINSYASTFSPEFIKQAADFNNNLDKLTISFKTFGATLAELVLPKLNAFFDLFFGKKQEKNATQFLEGNDRLTKSLKDLKGTISTFSAADVALLGQVTGGMGPKKQLQLRDPKAEADAEKKMTDALKERNAALVEQYKALGIIDTPFDRYRNQVMALDEGLKSGLLTQDQYLDKLFAAENAYQDGLPAIAQYREQVKELEAQIGVANISFREFSEGAVMTLEDSLVDLVSGTKSATEAFRNMANSIISDLIRMYIRYTITKPLFDFLFPSLLPAGQGAPIVDRSFASPGPKAIGGSVQAGGSYMVGERGPELFVPARSGSIVPNDQMGGGTVVINQSLNFSTGVAQTVRAEVMNMLPMISNAAKAAVADAKLRGGSFANAMR